MAWLCFHCHFRKAGHGRAQPSKVPMLEPLSSPLSLQLFASLSPLMSSISAKHFQCLHPAPFWPLWPFYGQYIEILTFFFVPLNNVLNSLEAMRHHSVTSLHTHNARPISCNHHRGMNKRSLTLPVGVLARLGPLWTELEVVRKQLQRSADKGRGNALNIRWFDPDRNELSLVEKRHNIAFFIVKSHLPITIEHLLKENEWYFQCLCPIYIKKSNWFSKTFCF